MTFSGGFVKAFRPAFDPGMAAAVPWWFVAGKTCVAAYQPKGAASLAASYVNLANPGTYDAAPGTAPAFAAATGWTFNGGAYLTTGFTFAATTATLLVRYSDVVWVSVQNRYGVILGSYSGTNLSAVYAYGDSAPRLYIANHGLLDYGAALLAGCVGFAGNTAFVNGSSIGTISPSTTPSPLPIYIGRHNTPSGPGTFLTGKIQAIVIYSDTLTAGEVAIKSAAMAAL